MLRKPFSILLLGLVCTATAPAMAEEFTVPAPLPVDEALLMPPSIESSANPAPVQQEAATVADASHTAESSHKQAVKPVNILKELETCAQAGDAKCQFTLGRMYATGDGVRQDTQEALRWYRRSALQKNPHALAAMAIAYRDGHGVQMHRIYASVLMSTAATIDKRYEKEALRLQDKLNMQEQIEAESAEEILKNH